jgi:hypothetical protein
VLSSCLAACSDAAGIPRSMRHIQLDFSRVTRRRVDRVRLWTLLSLAVNQSA